MTTAQAPGRVPEFDLHDRLSKARDTADLTQNDLGALIGVARRTVANYETGTTTPRRPVLVVWAMATGVDLHWLETGEPPTPGDGDGGSTVRPKGFEPLTSCSEGDDLETCEIVELFEDLVSIPVVAEAVAA